MGLCVELLAELIFLVNFSATAPIIQNLASMMVKGAITELSPVDPEQRLEHHQCGAESVWSGPTSPQETLSRGRDGAGEGRA